MKTFELKDINNEFFEKTLLIYISHSSGLGGPGYIDFIMKDKEYILSFLHIPFNEYALENLHPILKKNMDHYAFENVGFKKIKSNVYVKEDIYSKVKNYCQNKTIFLYREVIEQVMHTKIETIRYIEDVKHQQELARQEEMKKANQFSLSDLKWNVLEINLQEQHVMDLGKYVFYHKKTSQNQIHGIKMTIRYQINEETKKIESYNVYIKETKYWFEEITEYEYGEFVKACSCLEHAEKYVVEMLNRYNFNKNNVVNSLSKKEEQNERVRYYKPIVLFGENVYKICELIKNIPYKDAVYNLMEYFKIDEDLAERILELNAKDLRYLNKAKELV